MLFNPLELYSARKKENAETIMPYMHYVGQSGLLLVLAFLGIMFVDQYIKLIRYTPDSFPLELVVTAIIGLVILYTPYRTWLKPADIIYVMPRQAEMKRYFDACARRGFILSSIPLVILTLLAYIVIDAYKGDAYASYYIFGALLMKANIYKLFYNLGELTNRLLVVSIKLMLLVLSLLSVYAVFIGNKGILLFVLCLALTTIVGLYVQSQTTKFTNWQFMIEDEQRKLHRIFRFLNLFVDIPNAFSNTKKRTYLASLSALIGYKRSQTFAYLHYLTFARSEVGGIFIRNIIVGAAIATIFASTMIWDGYGGLVLSVVFMGVNAVQLTTLRRIHQHSVWQAIYPIPLDDQFKQMTAIEIKLLVASSGLIALVPAIMFALKGNLQLALLLAAAIILVLIWRLIVIRNIMKKELHTN